MKRKVLMAIASALIIGGTFVAIGSWYVLAKGDSDGMLLIMLAPIFGLMGAVLGAGLSELLEW